MPVNFSPALSSAGLWSPIAANQITSSWNGILSSVTSQIVPLGATGAYGLVVDGFANPTPTPATPVQTSLGILSPDGSGGVTLDTSDYLSDATTWGAQSVLVGDFNGDGKPDVVLAPYNESPFLGEPGTALMSNGSGGFTKVALPGAVLAHDAEVTTIDGQLAITTATFSPGDANPIFTYADGVWTEHLSTSLDQGGFGDAEQIAQFAGPGQYELVRGDVSFAGLPYDITVNGFDAASLAMTADPGHPIQKITPYLSTLSQYAAYASYLGAGITHVDRIWSLDLNNDGKLDLLVGESMFTPNAQTYPSALQVLLNNGDGTFRDATASLNPDMGLNTDELDYNPTFLDIDHSGIPALMFSSATFQGASRQSNYLVLNDGTGRLYVALHDQFATLQTAVSAYLSTQYGSLSSFFVNGFSKFIALPQADGSLDYVAEVAIEHQTAGVFQLQYAFVNAPIHYDPTTDFTQDVTVADRNGSTLMRTWAGNDTFHDTDSGANAHIDGGLGLNTSVYSGALSQYQLATNADGSVTVTSEAAGVPQVNDTLVHIQTLQFSDTTLSTTVLATVGGWVSSLLRESLTGAHAQLATQTAAALTSGADSQAQALHQILTAAENTSSVATMSYQFFTGEVPSSGGMDFLVSPTGPNSNNLNSAYYQSFNIENRYINFAVNLGKLGAGAAAFNAAYGSLDLFDATQKAYGVIFGIAPSDTKVHALLDPTVTLGGATMTRADYFAYYGGDGPNGIGTKAAMVGWLLAEAVLADVGSYAKSNDAFLTDVATNGAPWLVDMIGHYNQASFAFNGG